MGTDPSLGGGATAWLQLIGPARVHTPAAPPRDLPDTLPGLLLAYLGTQTDGVDRDALATLFWDGEAPAQALRALRVTLSRLQAQLGQWGLPPGTLQAERRRVRLTLPSDWGGGRHAPGPLDLELAGRLAGAGFAANLGWDRLPRLAAWAAAETAQLRRLARGLLLTLAAEAPPALAEPLLARERQIEPDDESLLLAQLAVLEALGRPAEAAHALESHLLRQQQELGVAPPAQLLQRLQQLRTPPAAATERPAAAGEGPAPGLVGRDAETAVLSTLLREPGRVVVLTGLSGVGKSSLAAEVGRRVAGRGVALAWVPAAAAASADELRPRLMQALGVAGALREGRDHEALRERGPLLLVVDGAEALLGDAAPAFRQLLQGWLDAAPALRLLVTSWWPAGLAGERVHTLTPLPVPADTALNWFTPALRLLLAEAGRARPGFDPTPHRGPLCALARALGGLPLALKLVGRWLALLSPQEVLDSVLQDPVAVDPAGRFEQALALGWQQLDAAQQQTLRVFSVYAGGVAFDDLEGPAAERVAVLERLALLGWIDRGAAASPAPEAGSPWQLHPLVRAWLARQRAADPGLDGQARAQHAQAQRRALARWADWRRIDQAAALADLRRRWPELRLLWADGLAALDGDGLRLLALPLTRLFEFDGRVREGHALFAAAARRLEAAGAALVPARAACLRAAALLLYRDSRYDEAEREATVGLALADALQDRDDIKGCLNTRALSRWMQARLPEARQDAERACAMARQDDDSAGLAVLASTLALIHKRNGDWAEAEAVFTECLALHRETGNRMGEMVTLGNLGNLCLVQGRVAEAQAAYEQQMAIAERQGWRSQRAFALANLVRARLAMGDLAAADTLLERAWQDTVSGGEPTLLGFLALYRAQSALLSARLADAAGCLAFGLRLSLALAVPTVLLEGLALHARWCLACGDADTARVSHGLAAADARLHAELRAELDADRARHPALASAGPAEPRPDLRAWVEQQCAALQAAAGDRQIPWPVEKLTASGGAGTPG